MRIGVPSEIAPSEKRVAAVPETVTRFAQAGFEVLVQSGAGEPSSVPNRAYEEAGARIVPDAAAVLGEADVVLKVARPQLDQAADRYEVDLMQPGAVVISFLIPSAEPDLLRRLAERGLTAFSMDLIPRLSRAQPMDARSAMSMIAGYRAVVIAAHGYPRFFPLLSTAAGTAAPARVLVLGAGVAGLQAVATARRLGAQVSAFDVRPSVRQEVESLGARFLSLDVSSEELPGGYARGLTEEDERRQREQMAVFVRDVDIVITSAFVPGKRAPLLVTEEMVAQMKPGSQIVDLAAEQGGNCELTQAGRSVARHGVTVHGPVNLPSAMPAQASQWYARTIANFLLNMQRDGRVDLDADDPIVRESCVVRDGRIVAASSTPGLRPEVSHG